MAHFDFFVNPIVGTLSINDSSGNGYVKVFGYMDNSIFHKLSESEAIEIFTPDGCAFAHNILQHYYGLNNSLVCMYVMPNQKEGGKNAYLWNKDYQVEPIGLLISMLHNRLSDDGGVNYDILTQKHILGRDDDVFFLSGDRLYYIAGGNDSRLIPYCNYDNNLPIISTSLGTYYIEYDLPRIDGYIDSTNDEQLVNWFLRLLKTNITEIQTGTGEDAIQTAKDALLAMKGLPEYIANARLDRLKRLTESFVISRDSLKLVAQFPWIKPTIDAAVERYREDFLSDIKKEYQQDLEKLKASHKLAVEEEIEKHDREIMVIQKSTDKIESQSKEKIKQLNEQISGSQLELERLNIDIKEKQNELSSIQKSLDGILERKDDIINDFKVVRDVLGLSKRQEVHVTSSVNAQKLPFANYSDIRLQFYKGFENNIESSLSLSQTKIKSVSELAKLHACFSVLLLPNIDIAMSIIVAAGKAFYRISYVSVAWKSFNDVWTNGLQQIVTHCSEMPDSIHYFVLRNINLSCLSNYLQPLADMLAGVLNTFPETDIQFPDNLRILLTVSDEELIPMSEGMLKFFGCVSKDIETVEHGKIDYSTAKCLGYLDTKLLRKASEEITKPDNYYQEYLDE